VAGAFERFGPVELFLGIHGHDEPLAEAGRKADEIALRRNVENARLAQNRFPRP